MAAWRHPDGIVDFDANIQNVINLAKVAERGLFDLFFMADQYTFWRGPMKAMSHDAGGTWIEPFTVMASVAQHTTHVGLVCTSSTSYDKPYQLARRFAALDLASGGRAGWNLVTSGNPAEADSFGVELIDKRVRYRMAREFAYVARGLWNSWGSETFVRDPQSGLYFDPDKLNVLEHDGEFFKARGPLNVPPSPQGEPVLVQAGASEDGRELAAATAEIVFGLQQYLEPARSFYSDVKGRAAKHGRNPDDLKIMPGLTYIVAETREQAEDEFEEMQELIDPVMGMALLANRVDFDFSGFDVDDPVPLIPVTQTGGSRTELINDMVAKNPGMTLKDLYKHFAGARGHGLVTGTAQDMADHMQQWVEEEACDGFNIMPPLYPRDALRFVDLVVPELQRRGLYKTAYRATTLRGNLGIQRPGWSAEDLSVK